jgi:hypothetical protein
MISRIFRSNLHLYFRLKATIAAGVIFIMALLMSNSLQAGDNFTLYPLRDPAIQAWPAAGGLPENFRNNAHAFIWTAAPASEWSIAVEEAESGLPRRFDGQALPPPLRAYALLIDDSISMWPEWEKAKESLTAVFGVLPRNGLLGIYSFSEDLSVIRGFEAADPEAGLAEAASLALTGRATLLQTSLKKACDALAALPVLRREIILFSDGGDEDRAMTSGELIKLAVESGVVIHAVAFSGSPNQRTPPKRDPRDMGILRRLAEETGGLFLAYENLEQVREAFSGRPDLLAGACEILDPASLPLGQSKLKVTFRGRDASGQDVQETQMFTVEGAYTLDNLLASLSRVIGGRDPRRIFFAALLGAIGAFCLLRLARGLSRRKRLAKLEAEKAKLEEESRKIQDEQKEKLETIAQKLEKISNLDKKSAHKPEKAYGWLIDAQGPVYSLTKPSTRIGRGPGNDVILPDAYVSNEHAILDFKNGAFVWTDRAPQNPTRINNEPVNGSRIIHPGDSIQCGQAMLRFSLDVAKDAGK